MKTAKPLIVVVLITIGVFWGWSVLFPSPEKQIKAALTRLAQTASFGANEKSLTRLGAINAVPTFFHTNAVVRLAGGRYGGSLEGKQEIREAVAGSRAVAQSIDIQLTDPQVTLKDSEAATVLVTATVYVDGDPTPQLQILKMEMVRAGRKWVIKQINPIDLDDV